MSRESGHDSPVSRVADVHLSLQRLLADVRKQRDRVEVASLTAERAQDTRLELLTKVQKLVEELYAVRNAEHLAEEGQVHVYRTLTTLIRVENSILNDAGLDEIQALLEDADADLSQAKPSAATRAKNKTETPRS
jgi:pyruvate formate-lyase activating enzyme-like uncharacterized protein